MKYFTLVPALLMALSGSAQAHEIWIEREAGGSARIYLGEPAQPVPANGDPEFSKLQSPRVLFASNPPLLRRNGYIEVALPPGDVRVQDDNVFAPWGKEGERQSVVYYARSGRQEPATALPLEFAPDAPGSNRLLLIRGGKPLAGVEISLIDPTRAEIKLTTDSDGAVTVPENARGRYLLSVSIKDQGRFQTAHGPVSVLYHISTLSFFVP